MTTLRASDIARIAAERAVGVDGVARLDPGPLRTKSTYGPSGRTDGVTVRTGTDPVEVTVHVAVAFGEAIPELAERVDDEVGAALHSAFPDVRCNVALDVVDLIDPGPSPEPSSLPSPGAPSGRVLR